MLLLTTWAGIAFALLLVFFRATTLDFWGTVLCVLMMSISSLFYIIMAQWFFGKLLRVVPLSGFAPGLDLLKFLLLPVIVGIVYQLGSEARLFRAMLLEESSRDYVRTARAKGLSEPAVLFGHVLRNAWLPILTHVGALLPYMFLGSLVFESFFGIPGLGTFTIEAISAQDFAVVHAMVFLGSLLYILAYLATDIAYTFVDPRVRLTH
jgi:peptide/nickel transport system permease protein